MTRYLLDTNHLSAAIGRAGGFRDRIDTMAERGARFATCFPVICEVAVGIRQTHRPASAHARLSRILAVTRIWPIDWDVVSTYVDLALFAAGRGRNIGFVDMAIAALSIFHGVTILTTDRDFEAFPDIKTENWLA